MTIVTKFPTVNAVDVTGLTNPNNAHADNGIYATGAPSKNQRVSSDYSGFDFDSSIPVGSTINTVKLIYDFKVSATNSVANANIAYVTGGAHGSLNEDATEPLADKTVTVDVTSARSWVRDDLLDATFLVHLEGHRGNSNNAVTFSFDFVKVEVDYTASLEEQVTATWNLRHDLASVVTRTWNIRHDLAAQISQTWNLRHDLSSTVSRVWNLRHDLSSAVSQTWNLRHDLSAYVSQSWNIRHDLAAQVTNTWNLRHDLISGSQVTQTWNMRHDLASVVSQVWNLRHGLLSGVEKIWSFRHDLSGSISRLWSFRHDLLQASQIRHPDTLSLLITEEVKVEDRLAQKIIQSKRTYFEGVLADIQEEING